MMLTALVLGGIAFFFGVILLTLLLGALGKRDEKEILLRNAEDIATGEGSMTLPPHPDGHYHDNPV